MSVKQGQDNEGGDVATDLLTEAKQLRLATVASMIKEIAFLKMVIRLLGVAVAVMVLGVGLLCYRTIYVTGPTVENTNEIVNEVRDNSSSLHNLKTVVDELKSFVDEVKRNANPALQAERDRAIFDIRRFACTRDPSICEQAGVVPIPPPSTSTSSP